MSHILNELDTCRQHLGNAQRAMNQPINLNKQNFGNASVATRLNKGFDEVGNFLPDIPTSWQNYFKAGSAVPTILADVLRTGKHSYYPAHLAKNARKYSKFLKKVDIEKLAKAGKWLEGAGYVMDAYNIVSADNTRDRVRAVGGLTGGVAWAVAGASVGGPIGAGVGFMAGVAGEEMFGAFYDNRKQIESAVKNGIEGAKTERQEGLKEIQAEREEAAREIANAKGARRTWEQVEGGLEVGLQAAEGTAEVVGQVAKGAANTYWQVEKTMTKGIVNTGKRVVSWVNPFE